MRVLELLGGDRQLQIDEARDWENDAGAVLWDAGLVLAYYLEKHPSIVAGKRVIELGCGPGAVGLAAAALGAAAAVLTDLPHVLPLAAANIEANGLSHVAAAAPLAWGDPLQGPLLTQPFDLVLASDVLYQQEALPLFVRTFADLCATGAHGLLCCERRPTLPLPTALFEGAGLRLCAVPLGEQHPEWRSEDIELFEVQLKAAGGGSSS